MTIKKKGLRYDRKAKRFRDSLGRFVSYDRGIRSTIARKQYRAAPKKSRYVPKPKPKKKKLIPPKVCGPIPYVKLPDFYLGNVYVGPNRELVHGQEMVQGISRWGICTLANLILHQINAGFIRFRFFYKIVKSGFIYTDTTLSGSKIGSTSPLHKSIITYNGRLEEVVSFLQGRGNFINGKVIYYWLSKRMG